MRLSVHAPALPPVLLARAKEVARLLYASAVLCAGLALSATQAEELQAFASSFATEPAAAATACAIMLWSGLVTTAFPTWAQSYGQQTVSAGTASVIYSSQPLWSALFGFLVLGEQMGGQAAAGAAVILAAVLWAGSQGPGLAGPADLDKA